MPQPTPTKEYFDWALNRAITEAQQSNPRTGLLSFISDCDKSPELNHIASHFITHAELGKANSPSYTVEDLRTFITGFNIS